MAKDDDLIWTWEDLKAAHTGEFVVSPFYDPDTDTLTVYIRDEPSCRERIDRYLTVYREFQTGEVTGCDIKHVRRKLLATVRLFNIGIEPESLTLGVLLLAIPLADVPAEEWAQRPPSRVYRELVQPLTSAAGSMRCLTSDGAESALRPSPPAA
jgi:hypothetical protein